MTGAAASLVQHILQPLSTWLSADRVEDVAIQRPDECWIRRQGQWICEAVEFTADECMDIAILAAALRRQDIGPEAPLCSSELPGGERLQICLPPITPQYPALTIRKHQATVSPLADVGSRYRANAWNKAQEARGARARTLLPLYETGNLQDFLRAAVLEHLNILLVGVTGSGKTTLATTLVSAIPPTERIITIEDTLELTVEQPNAVRLLYSKDALSQANVGPEALIEASLRMRPDRLIIGELREEQPTWTFLHQTTIDGTISTIHGHDAASGAQRFFTLCKGSAQGRGLDADTLTHLLASAIDVILPLESRGGQFSVGGTWFAATAADRGETIADLLKAA